MQGSPAVKSGLSVSQNYFLRLKVLLSMLNPPKTINASKKVQEGLFFSPSPHFKRLASAYRLSLAERVARAIELSPRAKVRLSPRIPAITEPTASAIETTAVQTIRLRSILLFSLLLSSACLCLCFLSSRTCPT